MLCSGLLVHFMKHFFSFCRYNFREEMSHKSDFRKPLRVRNSEGNKVWYYLLFWKILSCQTHTYMYQILKLYFIKFPELPWREKNDLEWNERCLHAEVRWGNVQVYRYHIYKTYKWLSEMLRLLFSPVFVTLLCTCTSFQTRIGPGCHRSLRFAIPVPWETSEIWHTPSEQTLRRRIYQVCISQSCLDAVFRFLSLLLK